MFHAITFEGSGFTKIEIQASAALNPLVSLFGCLVARNVRISADTYTHMHRPSIVTLAVHARRGLMNIASPRLGLCCIAHCESIIKGQVMSQRLHSNTTCYPVGARNDRL